MKNKIIKFLAYDKKVAVMCIDSSDLVEEVRKIHDLTPTVTAALGRVVTAGAMMSYLETKETSDHITLQIKGNGPIGSMVVITGLESPKKAYVKSYVENPQVEMPLKPDGKIDVGGAVGQQGYLNVIRHNEITRKRLQWFNSTCLWRNCRRLY